MGQKVWCVFQRLPGESCPGLAAVCASRETAEELVRISEKDEEEQGRPASVWTIGSWGVLDGEVGKIDDIQHISDVMDPMREGVLPLEEDEPAGRPDSPEEAEPAGAAESPAGVETQEGDQPGRNEPAKRDGGSKWF